MRVHCALDLTAPSAPITGRVRFADGRPVARAELSATCLAMEKGWLFYHALTAARGEYTLAVPDVGQRFHISIVSRDEHLERDDVAAGTTGIDFVFSDLHPLRVRLVDAATGTTLVAGDAVQLAVRAGGVDFAPVRLEGDKPDLDGWSELWLAATRVDLLALPAHRDLAGYGLVLSRDVELDAKDGSVPRVELRLERAAPLVLELDAKGEPWPDEHELVLLEEELLDTVQPSAGGWESQLRALPYQRRVELDEHGRAELAGFAPGRYRFLVFPEDVALDPAEIVVERGGGPAVLLRWRRAR